MKTTTAETGADMICQCCGHSFCCLTRNGYCYDCDEVIAEDMRQCDILNKQANDEADQESVDSKECFD